MSSSFPSPVFFFSFQLQKGLIYAQTISQINGTYFTFLCHSRTVKIVIIKPTVDTYKITIFVNLTATNFKFNLTSIL